MTTTPTTPQQAGALSDGQIMKLAREAASLDNREGHQQKFYLDFAHALLATAATDSAARAAPSNLVDAADDLLEALRQIAEAGSAHSMPAVDMVEALRNIAKDAIKRAAPVHTETKPKVKDCPHAGPFRYCPECVVSPCPIGFGGKK